MFLRNLILIAVALAVTLAGGLLPTPHQAQGLFAHGAYYFLLVLVAVWSLKMLSLFGHHLKQWRPSRVAALVLAAILTAWIFIHAPPRFKILADESNLTGVSMMMHRARIAAVPLEGLVSEHRQADIATTPTKRPLLFPFLLSVIHTLKGYSPSNAFLLNFMVTLASLFAFSLFASRLFSPAMALPSMLVLASAPILSFYATGGGFEALNMLFLMLTFLMLIEVVASEGEPNRVELLFLTALMLAQCRYESVIVLVLLALCLFHRLLGWGSLKRLSVPGCFLPLFLLPVLWQRRMFLGLSEINRVDYGVLQAVESPFSWRHLVSNMDDNLFVLMGLNPDYGFTFPLALMALAGGLALLRKALRGCALPVAPLVLTTITASLLALLVIISAFYWGNFGLQMDNRLALVFLPFIALAALYALRWMQHHQHLALKSVVMVLLVVHLLYFGPYASNQRLLNGLSLPFEYQRVVAHLQQTYDPDDELLIIAELPNLYIIQPHSAVNLSHLKHREAMIRSQQDRFTHIIALQKVDRGTGEITPATAIGPPFQLTHQQDIPITTRHLLRISECRLREDLF